MKFFLRFLANDSKDINNIENSLLKIPLYLLYSPSHFAEVFAYEFRGLAYRNHIGSNYFQSRQLHFVHFFYSLIVKHCNNRIPSILWILSVYEAPEQNINIIPKDNYVFYHLYLPVYIFILGVLRYEKRYKYA